jgi:hypothetical protein
MLDKVAHRLGPVDGGDGFQHGLIFTGNDEIVFDQADRHYVWYTPRAPLRPGRWKAGRQNRHEMIFARHGMVRNRVNGALKICHTDGVVCCNKFEPNRGGYRASCWSGRPTTGKCPATAYAQSSKRGIFKKSCCLVRANWCCKRCVRKLLPTTTAAIIGVLFKNWFDFELIVVNAELAQHVKRGGSAST